MHSFLLLIALGNSPFPALGQPTSGIVSGLKHCSHLSQGGEVRQPEIRRLADKMRTQAMSKLRGEGPSPPFSIAPQVLL